MFASFHLLISSSHSFAETTTIASCKELNELLPITVPGVYEKIDFCQEIKNQDKHILLAVISLKEVIKGSTDETLQNTWGHNICQSMVGSVNSAQRTISYACLHDQTVENGTLSFLNLIGLYPCPMLSTNDERSYGYKRDPAGGISDYLCQSQAPRVDDGREFDTLKLWLMFKLPEIKTHTIKGKVYSKSYLSVENIKVTIENLTYGKSSTITTNKTGKFRFKVPENSQYKLKPFKKKGRGKLSPEQYTGLITNHDINHDFSLTLR